MSPPSSAPVLALEAALAENEGRFRALMAGLQVGVVIQGLRSDILLFNQRALDLLDMTEDQLKGKSSLDPSWNIIREDGSAFHAEDRPVLQAVKTKSLVSDVTMGIHRPRRSDRVWLLVSAMPQTRDDGSIVQVVATFTDITGRKMIEEIARAQSRVIAEIGAPLIPIGERIVLMPLIGAVDRARAERVLEVLLRGVCDRKARTAILDITGVPALDEDAARALRTCAEGLRLLGSRCIITGIQPKVAGSLVVLDIDLGEAEIYATLERGLAAARMAEAPLTASSAAPSAR